MKQQLFHLGDILSITTDKLVSLNHISAVYEILNFMTGDSLMTHQLPRVGRECKPWLLKQHPQLQSIDASIVNNDNWKDWLTEQVELFGKELLVEAIPQDAHQCVNPLTELVEMVGQDKAIIIVVEPPA